MLSGLCNYLVSAGYCIRIVTYDGSVKSFFELHPSVEIETLPVYSAQPKKNYLLKFLDLYKDIRIYKNMPAYFKEATTFVATDYLVAAVLFFSNKGFAKKMIVWEHLSFTVPLTKFWALIRKKVYTNIKSIVTLNKEEQAFYKTMGCNSLCIANPIEQQLQLDSRTENIVWVGAITKEKGIDDLLQTGLLLKEKKIKAAIHIYGSGECLEQFSEDILNSGLQEILMLKGTVKDIDAVYKNTALLLVTSSHECFPTVILEAFSFGIPVVSYDCPTGPRNIITEGKDGYLIEQGNVNGMVEKIELLLANRKTLALMSASAFESSHRYLPGAIYPQWLPLFS